MGWARSTLAVFVFLAPMVTTGTGAAQAPRVPAKAPPSAPILLELFTSEGCSSCPPADDLLRELSGATSASGHLLIALSEHVTYWNRLGWSDPFSAEIFTERQNGYSQRFHLDSPYTPQLVVNGSAQVVGSNRRQVEHAIAGEGLSSPKLVLRILSAKQAAQGITIAYSVQTPLPTAGADLFAVIADDLDQAKVLRGENGGRTLAHVAVARSFTPMGPLHATGEREQVTIPLSPSGDLIHGHQHVVLFAQAPQLGPVLGVDAQPIVEP